MEFKKNILILLMSCIDHPSSEEINSGDVMENILARLRNKRIAEIKQIIKIIDQNDYTKITSFTYDKFIEIYDNYGLGGFIF